MAGQRKQKNPRTSSIVYRTGGLYVETNLQEKPAKTYDELEDAGVYSLENVASASLVPATGVSATPPKEVSLNLKGENLALYARYGSLEKLINGLLGELISNFPGALHFLPSAGHSYSYDSYSDASTLTFSVAHLENPFELIYRDLTIATEQTNSKNLNLRWPQYCLCRPDSGEVFEIISFSGATDLIPNIIVTVEGEVFRDGGSPAQQPLLLKPGLQTWDEFIGGLHPFQRHLLSDPDVVSRSYRVKLSTAEDDDQGGFLLSEETLEWMFPDGHNLDISSDQFVIFFNRLLRISQDFDLTQGKEITRRYTPASLLAQDFTAEDKQQKLLMVTGRFFDELNRRIGAFPSLYRWRYDQQDAVPAALTLQQADNEGWVTTSFIPDQKGQQRLWHAIARQTYHIFHHKGGRRAVEDFIDLLGMIPGLVTVEEFIYEISDIQPYPSEDWDTYFQQRGDQDGGAEYIGLLSGSDIIYMLPDTQKSWSQVNDRNRTNWSTRYELYYGGVHEVNTKFIDLKINREEILALFQQAQEDCDPHAYREFTRLLDGQIERFKNIYFPYIRENLLGATVIFSSEAGPVMQIEHQMLASSPGGSDGGVILDMKGGTAPYTFFWSDGTTSSDPIHDKLPAGEHWVLVVDSSTPPVGRRFNFTVLENPNVEWRPVAPVCSTDNYGYREYNELEQFNVCLDESTGIRKPNLPGDPNYVEPYPTLDCVDREIAITVSKVDTPCWDSGARGGSYNLSVQYAVAPFKYFYQNSQGSWVEINSSSRSNLTKGTYRYRVADVLGRDKEGSVTIGSQSSRPSISLTPTAATGCSLNSGSIRASVSGGRGSYSYTWQKLNSSWSNISVNSPTNPSNLSPGTYRLRIIDDCGSTYSSSVNVADNTTLSSLSIGNISVVGASDGSDCPAILRANYSGTPAGSVRFEWKDSAGTVVGTSRNFDQAACGATYSVTIWDDCKAKGSLNNSFQVPDDPCATASPPNLTGGVVVKETSVNATDHIKSYTVTDDHNTAQRRVTFSSTVELKQAYPYDVKVDVLIDYKAGAEAQNEHVTQVAFIELVFAAGTTALSGSTALTYAPGDSYDGMEGDSASAVRPGRNGSITINSNHLGGGTTPYNYQWTGPGAYSSSNRNISGLKAGDYTLKVTDDCGKTSSRTYTVVGPNY